MLNFASFVVVLVSLAVVTNGFLQVPSNRNSKFLSMQINSKPEKSIIIELIARKEITGKRLQSGREVGQKKQSGLKSRASAGLYKEKGDTIMEKLVDSPVSTLASFLLNPTTLVLVVYLSSVAWGQVSWVQVRYSIY